MTNEQRVLNRARALMQNKGMKRGDAFAAAAESVQRESDERVHAILHDPSISTKEIVQRIVDGYAAREALKAARSQP